MKRLHSILLCSVFITCSVYAADAQTGTVARRHAQVRSQVQNPPAAVSALFVSDIHFEPFWDPAKVPQLAKAPVGQWKAILTAPASATQAQRFSQLQDACHARGADSPDALVRSSLRAMHAQAADAALMTISGDLLAHDFSCKYATLFPNAAPEAYRAFVQKTIEYLLGEVRAAFPGMPIYTGLGNNDSDCGDYHLDAQSPFLTNVGHLVAGNLPEADRDSIEHTFAAGGYYSASLPIQHTRLLVLEDVFASRKYQTCGGKSDPAPVKEQWQWLRDQLTKARQGHEKVWVMGHIPPGIDPYSTALKFRNVCGGQAPEMFLSSDELPQILATNGDVIQLAIFAHTHMNEIRLLPSQQGTAVAMKLVPSVSPINGNHPSFTVASVATNDGLLKDYRVFTASNNTGVNTQWTQEYDFDQTYSQSAFSAETATKLVHEFLVDPGVQSADSQAYLRNFGLGSKALQLMLFWPQYKCSLANYTADDYKTCLCSKTSTAAQ